MSEIVSFFSIVFLHFKFHQYYIYYNTTSREEIFETKFFPHFGPHFSSILTKKKKSNFAEFNFAEFNFADRAKIRTIKFRENFFRKNLFS